jgi:hypothetical protein
VPLCAPGEYNSQVFHDFHRTCFGFACNTADQCKGVPSGAPGDGMVRCLVRATHCCVGVTRILKKQRAPVLEIRAGALKIPPLTYQMSLRGAPIYRGKLGRRGSLMEFKQRLLRLPTGSGWSRNDVSFFRCCLPTGSPSIFVGITRSV